MYEVKEKIEPMPAELNRGKLGKAIDRAIYQLWPSWGLKRYATRRMSRVVHSRLSKLSSGFRSRDHDRVRSDRYIRSWLSPDADAEMDLEEIQQECLELYKTNPIAHSAVEGRTLNEIGGGIRFQSRLQVDEERGISKDRAKEFNKAAEDMLRRWSEAGIDRKGVNSLAACERIVCRTFANYGEAFVRFVNDPVKNSPIPLTWDIIDPFRVQTPPQHSGNFLVRLGVQYDEFGRVVGYWVRKNLTGDLRTSQNFSDADFEFVERFDSNGHERMVHIFEQTFPQQTRGFPWLVAARSTLKDLGDWIEAEIIKKQIEACLVAFIKSPKGRTPYETSQGAATSTDGDKRIEDLSPGAVEYIGNDEEVTMVNPSQGAAVLAPFAELMLRTIAGAAQYPFELLVKNFVRVTFASGRLAMLDGRKGFLARRQPICEKLLTPTYKLAIFQGFWIGELKDFVDLGLYLSMPHLYERHACLAPGFQFIDPEKEVNAHAKAIKGDMETLSEPLAERGVPFDEHMQQQHREREEQIKQQVALRKLRWDEEESAGLPHMEEQGEDADGVNATDTPEEDSEQQSEFESVFEKVGA